MVLRLGKKAPDFSLPDIDGTPRALGEFTKNGTVILAFFPFAFSGVCDKEMCMFRDGFGGFQKAGAQLVGVSVDSMFALKAFARTYNLQFPLLSDFNKRVTRLYGVGANPAGHLGYRGDEIGRGDMVKLDFGVRYEGYCSDIQRVYYVGGGAVPSEVKKTFDTARRANDVALAFLKPGVPGWKVDAAARRLIVREGFPEYKHALGHVLGRSTHEIGPLLGPRWPNRYGEQGEKEVEKDMVFTIEPSVEGKVGVCNLEQDVLVTESGYRALSKSQSEIITLG